MIGLDGHLHVDQFDGQDSAHPVSAVAWESDLIDAGERAQHRGRPRRSILGKTAIYSVYVVCAVLIAMARRSAGLHFRLPKDGRHYDTSEAVFWFEREADEDGYPVLEVDGVELRAFDFKQMEYEISLMGQQVGEHTATVRLMEYAKGEVDASENTELYNATVTYHIATPGTMDMRHSIQGMTTEGEEARRRGETMLAQGVALLKSGGQDKLGEAAELLEGAIAVDEEIVSRRYRGEVVAALHEYAQAGGQIRLLFDQPAADAASRPGDATADVLSSEGGAELCADRRRHELAAVLDRVHPRDPYEAFDAEGLQYSAGEHQGHDQSLMAILIHVTRPHLIIEVGSWKGGSAIQMSSVLRERGWGCRTKLMCVDTWLGTSTDLKAQRLPLKNGYPTVYREFMHNVMQAGVSSVVIPVPAPANIASKMLAHLLDREEIPTADLIFIDGNHDYDDVRADIRNYFPLLSPNGLMFGDDFGWAGVKKAVYEFAAEHNMSVLSPGGRTWLMI